MVAFILCNVSDKRSFLSSTSRLRATEKAQCYWVAMFKLFGVHDDATISNKLRDGFLERYENMFLIGSS